MVNPYIGLIVPNTIWRLPTPCRSLGVCSMLALCVTELSKNADCRQGICRRCAENHGCVWRFPLWLLCAGRGKKGSDVDVAVVIDQVSGDYLDTMAALWRLMNTVDQDIEPVLLLTSNNESGFLDTIHRTLFDPEPDPEPEKCGRSRWTQEGRKAHQNMPRIENVISRC